MTYHKEQHTILEGLTDHGYGGMDVRTKVTCLLDGIQTETLDAVNTNILGSKTLRKDFEKCVILYKDFIKQSGSSRTENRRVAEISSMGVVMKLLKIATTPRRNTRSSLMLRKES